LALRKPAVRRIFLCAILFCSMAKKKNMSPIEKLTKTVERGFANVESRMERGFAAVAEDIADSKKATLEGFVRVEERLYSIEQELKDIKRRLVALESEFGRLETKHKQEIEQLWKHVAAIEKRLKMQR